MELTERHVEGLKHLLYNMADDLLILGHRNSEWTGMGPILEEDIAFSSMAQDKIGQSLALYNILHEMGEQEPDVVAFTRNSTNFHCAKLVELPIGEYDFSLVRHFLYDYADAVKFDMLSKSIFEPLAQVCRKFRGELKYHTMHANIWIKDLANGNEESKKRMQDSLNLAYPIAYSLFETNEYEAELKEAGIFAGESEQKKIWKKEVDAVILESGLTIPMVKNEEEHHGGRVGNHTEHLQPLLDEMTEVFQIDPTADW